MKKIILHACCAPCAGYPIKKLDEEGFRPVVFFYNPNIYPFEEYKKRRDELKNYCEKINIEFFEDKWETEIFYEKIKGYEREPEKGKRCDICFNLRLLKAAEFAKSKNIDCFTTTLTVSPHKDSLKIFEAGKNASRIAGCEFLEFNFKKHDGFKISRAIAKENNFYFQKYCGCEFSCKSRGLI